MTVNEAPIWADRAPVPARGHARTTAGRWGGLAVLLTVTVFVAMDIGVLFLALPSISAELAPSTMQQLWIADAYGLVMAGLLVPMGALGDRIGQRRLLLLGAGGFAIASAMAAFATSPGMLIASRALLGVAGATLMPSVFSLARAMFDDTQQRRLAISALTGAAASGAAIGPLVGALLLRDFWWGSVFLISIPAIVLLLVVGPMVLPDLRGRGTDTFDLAGALLSLGAVLTTVYGIKQAATAGLGLVPLGCVALGILLGASFLKRQARRPDALLDPRLFRHRGFAFSLLLNVLAMFVMMGFTQFTMQYLQLVAGLEPLEAALWSLPAPVGMIMAVSLAATLTRKVHPSSLMALGFGVAALGMTVMTQVQAHSALVQVIVGSTLLSSGIAMALGLIADQIIVTAPRDGTGAAAAMSETGKELGTALGTAVLGVIGSAVYTGYMSRTMPIAVPTELRQAAEQTVGGAAGAADQAGPWGKVVLEMARQAFTQQLNAAALAAVGVLIAGVLLALSLRRQPRHSDPQPKSDQPAGEDGPVCG